MKARKYISFCIWISISLLFIFHSISFYGQTWECRILPSERQIVTDGGSGARITFVTTHKSDDRNLYFHDRSWMLDTEVMLFTSDRTGRYEVFGYIEETGELIRFNRDEDLPASNPVASIKGNSFYILKGRSIYKWSLKLELVPETRASITETKIADFPQEAEPFHSLNENADGTLISFGYSLDDKFHIAVAEAASGRTTPVASLDFPVQHIQFSWTRPDLLSFARSYGSDTAPLDPGEPPHARIWFVSVITGTPVPAFYQEPGELVTHESWWVNDQVLFIGGHRIEEAHVKVFDRETGNIRIIGAGAWMEGMEARELSRVNWWHASGSRDGRWVAADNWHGVIAIFDAKTTRISILTTGHRTYGSGAHPHVGWDLYSKSVEFTSNKLGNPDVCIAELPLDWIK
jgi:oligogalacturonide lyase